MSNSLYGSQSAWKVVGALGLVYFIWGSTYLGIALAIETMPPMLMLGTRFALAGLIVFIWLSIRGRDRVTVKQWKNSAIAGTLLLCAGTGALAWAEQYIPSGLAAVIVTVSPVWMVTLDWLWKGGPRPNRFTVVGMILGILGILVLFDPTSVMGGVDVNVTAAVVLMLGSGAWAVGSLYGRHADLPADPFLSTATQMIGGGVSLLLVGVVRGEIQQVDVSSMTVASLGAWLYLIVFGSIVAFTAYVWLMKFTSPALVSTHAFVNPVVAVLLGWAFLNEQLNNQLFFATVLLVGGLIFISRSGRRAGRATGGPNGPTARKRRSDPMSGSPGQSRGVWKFRPPAARRSTDAFHSNKVA